MTQATSASDHHKKKRSKGSKLWIALSFTLSTVILGWAFSLPFRQPDIALLQSSEATGGFQGLDQIRDRRSSAEEFREAAIVLDDEFMRSIRKKREAEKRPHSGIKEARARWDRHVASVKKQLAFVKGAEEGTVEWEHRQNLLRSLDDGPQ